jgi:hypothetical protein
MTDANKTIIKLPPCGMIFEFKEMKRAFGGIFVGT